MLKVFKWAVILAIGLFLLLLMTGVFYQVGASIFDSELRSTPPGKLINIDGAKLHLHCTGSGETTFLLEAGGLSFSANWTLVQNKLTPKYRVCSYDRPGLGFSEELNDYDRVNSNLPFRLLETNGENGPYMLVGHSLGAILIRNLAALHPEKVAGLVFIDAGPPGPYANLSKEMRAYFAEGEQASHLLPTLARFGLLRFTFNPEDLGADFPADQAAVVKAFYSDPHHLGAGTEEFRQADELAIAAEALKSTDVPILSVIGRYDHNPVEGHRDAGLAYHQRLTGLTSGPSKLLMLEGAGHFDFLGEIEMVNTLSKELERLAIEVEPEILN